MPKLLQTLTVYFAILLTLKGGIFLKNLILFEHRKTPQPPLTGGL
jgi:hypothetical protein